MGDSPAARSRLKRLRPYLAVAAVVALGAGAFAGAEAASASTGKAGFVAYHAPAKVNPSAYKTPKTATPIQHVVTIFDENESFDHYFGTYPYAANTDGTTFKAKPGTPDVNGLYSTITSQGPIGPLLTSNPNEYNPSRLSHSEPLTSDQNHGYAAEEAAVDSGRMDMFVQKTESDACSAPEVCQPGIVMDYYDGNTVTALWNYAQNYSMSDNNWDTTFGPSTPGALNVISGSTQGASALTPSWSSTPNQPGTSSAIADSSMFGDVDPYYDECSDSNRTSTGSLGVMSGQNIGDLLNAKNITWGWFQGGFGPSATTSAGPTCGASHANVGGSASADYSAHHNPFEYYASTANPSHTAPSALSEIGKTDQANHQYDLSYFTDALDGKGGASLPAVSYLKAPEYQDAHPGYSDPLDEQAFLVNTINSIEKSKYWSSTAIVITYDDSDGWYDHQAPVVISGSTDATTDSAICNTVPKTVGTTNDRCGYSQRLPLVVISPYATANHVSSNLTDTASVVRFIEDNWLKGTRIANSFDAVSGSLDAPGGVLNFKKSPHDQPVILNPTSGAVVTSHH
ncbi:MAG TPA: alkaline phosphatase family protein [Trebonia sp.]|nr:alkaline phosphatase family protein [Trebonia sp.]